MRRPKNSARSICLFYDRASRPFRGLPRSQAPSLPAFPPPPRLPPPRLPYPLTNFTVLMNCPEWRVLCSAP